MSEVSNNLLKLSNKYQKQSNKMSEADTVTRSVAWDIERMEEKINIFETLIARKRVDFTETISFHSLKRDKEYTRPVQDIKIELDNEFSIDMIKKMLQEQVDVLKNELEELNNKAKTIYIQYVGGVI